MIDKVREIALKTLYKIEKEEAYSNIALDENIRNNREILNGNDIGFVSEIVYGVTTWKLSIDEIIKKYSQVKLKKISPWIINILRMGIYQIIFLDKVPKSAAVNESVNLAKRYGHKGSSNFVNAVLRKIEKTDFEEFNNIQDYKERISKITSMPIWIVEELLKEKDYDKVELICKNLNLKPNISIRINKLKTNKEDLKKELDKRNIKYEEGILENFLELSKVKNIENMDLFKDGYFTIQDESAGFAVEILNPQKGECILDACSAPGGKTTYIAELMENEGKIEAWDIYEHRINLINENAKRLGVDIIKAKINDATIDNNDYKEKFDKILLDVPCLGIGVIKRKPDIKWQRKPEDIEEISKIQFQILENCSRYLKRGGELVYSTCSILKEENEEIINKFLEKHMEFKICKYEITEKNEMYKFLEDNKYFKVYPTEKNDGFFICKLFFEPVP
ncbi:MAG: 16S rRNA (cytosine(967)-C(5))-methyltransferase RsmB [Clostridia bacterium]|nr:16S rRNA (cytosine(967)-C(5))-methyltransferase RsmB [Clostridia bacterium]